MTTPDPRVTAAREAAKTAAMELLCAELHLHDQAGATVRVLKAEDLFALRCRDYVNAIDEALPSARPKGWELDPDGRTA